MYRLHIYLIKSFIKPFIVTFFTSIFILLMQFLWKYIDDLVGKGLDFNQIAELIFYASARFVPLALPIATLLTSVMIFGKMGENYELIALKAAGISLFRLFFPLSVIAILISICSFIFSNNIMPIANIKSASMMYDIQKKKPALNIKEGIFYNDIEGYSIKVSKKSFDGKILEDIIIYDHTLSMENDKVIIAKKGKMNLTKDERFLELKLFDGHSYFEVNEKNNKNNPHRITRFKMQLIRFDLSSFSIMKNSEKLYKGHYAMLNVMQLNNAIDSLNNNYNNICNKYNDYYLSNYNKFDSDTTLIFEEQINEIKYEKQKNIALNKLKKLKSRIKSNNDNLRYKKIIIEKHKIEWHRKISLAYACFVFFLLVLH